jgi:hypothetical protein
MQQHGSEQQTHWVRLIMFGIILTGRRDVKYAFLLACLRKRSAPVYLECDIFRVIHGGHR